MCVYLKRRINRPGLTRSPLPRVACGGGGGAGAAISGAAPSVSGGSAPETSPARRITDGTAARKDGHAPPSSAATCPIIAGAPRLSVRADRPGRDEADRRRRRGRGGRILALCCRGEPTAPFCRDQPLATPIWPSPSSASALRFRICRSF